MTPQLKAEFDIREATIEDIPLIFSSWLKSYRDGAAVQSVPNSIYYAEHHRIIERIFAAPGLYIRVACDKEDPSHVYAYLVGHTGQDPVLHWVYTKFPFRNCGLAKALFGCFETDSGKNVAIYSHAGKISQKLVQKRNIIYNPYVIWS